jgi:hypothetical protein
MLHRVVFALFVGLGLSCVADPASAQFVNAGNVAGSAQIRFQAKPSKFRLQMQIRSFGTTVDAAIRNLKSQRDAVAAQLKELNADPASISFSIPQAIPAAATPSFPLGPAAPMATPALPGPTSYAPVPANDDPQPAEVARPSSARNPVRARPKLFVASATLRAEWPLEDANTDKIVAAAAAIREKVAAADLSANRTKQNLTPEEQELVEEAAMAPQSPSSSGMFIATLSDGKSSVAFVYVAVLSDEQRRKLLADGFAQAKKEAESLAEAAGKRLGDLVGLYSSSHNTCMLGRDFGGDYADSPLVSSDERETVAENPAKLEFRLDVSAAYNFADSKPKP